MQCDCDEHSVEETLTALCLLCVYCAEFPTATSIIALKKYECQTQGQINIFIVAQPHFTTLWLCILNPSVLKTKRDGDSFFLVSMSV